MVESTKSKVKSDSGTFWDESLDLYLGGAININLYNNVVGFSAGDPIAGTIDIEIVEPFPASELTLEFKGVERSHLNTKNVLKPLDFHREVKEIISMKTVVATFGENEHLLPGQYTYSFQVYLPEWLPESCLYKSKTDKFWVEYTLRAQFTPVDKKMFVYDPVFQSKYANVSLFRGSRKIQIFKKPEPVKDHNYKLQIKTSVGNLGLKLFGSSESICHVSFSRNVYWPGDQVPIGIDCDNTKCKAGVKSYKFKLFR